MTQAGPPEPPPERAPGRRLASLYAVLLAVAAFGLFAQLGDRPLWGDEAETALLAQNVLRFGVPRVDDGHNRIAHLGVADANDAGIWIWSPWLDEYATALSFAIAGPSAASARLPFALAGLATLVLLGWFVQRVWRDHELTLTAMALLTTSLPFLLHARQARYYALVTLAMVWLLVGLQQALRGRRLGAASIAGALAILFYSNYVTLPGPLAALAVFALAFGAKYPGLRSSIALGIGAFGVLALPWVVYAGIGSQAGAMNFSHFGANLAYYASELHFHVVPWIVFAIAAAAIALRGGERPALTREFALFIALVVGFQLLLLAVSPFRFFRYLTPLIPPLLLLTALAIRWSLPARPLRVALVAVLCTSNVLAWASLFPLARQHPLAAPHARLLASLLHDYDDRLSDVVAFLERNAAPSESISVADPEFPLIFHTGMAVRDARREWPPTPPLPDWVLVRSPSAVAAGRPLVLPDELVGSYIEERVPVRGSARGGSRPDPHAYEFFTAPETEVEILYRVRR